MKLKKPREERGRTVRAGSSSDPSPDHKYAAFSLRHVVHEFCVTNFTDSYAKQFTERMKLLCSMTWQEIRNAPRHGLGTEKISRHALRVPIPAHVTEDVTFLSLRCFGKAPMVGYRDGEVFFVLWFDPDFKIYDHGS